MGSLSACKNCDVRSQALCCALPAVDAERLHQMAHRRRFPRGKVIVSGDNEEKWFAVIVRGVVKLVRTKRDGRQLIVGLQFPGDFVGRPFGKQGPIQIEAATDLDMCCFSRASFEELLRDQPELEHALLQRTFVELEAARQWMFVLGRLTAREKVASFIELLIERKSRLTPPASNGKGPVRYELPLSRTEMGEFLGLTIETVSRQISQLKSEGVIDTEGLRTVIIHDAGSLRKAADNTIANW